MDRSKPNILVLCTGNSCRSQIAEGWFRELAGEQVDVYSAGVETHGVNPRAIQVMGECGVDISGHTSTHIKEYEDAEFDLVFTVCDHAREQCPVFPGAARTHHRNFKDPSTVEGSDEEILDAFRSTRDEIRDYVEELLKEMNYI